jgi:hypothetical protein
MTKNFSMACYYASDAAATISQAEAECGLRGGRLASFASAAEIPTGITSGSYWTGP